MVKNIFIKRVYEEPAPQDGYRILVDRLWPRGMSKDRLKIDFWAKDWAPSSELRKWFAHDPQKWIDFSKKYQEELLTKEKEITEFFKNCSSTTVTLVYSAKDSLHNQAIVLKSFIENRIKGKI
ncbi:DUF488 domain-containing protein [Methylacidiphilum caldifontis]|uniref:MarR family transcriptional regulator n=1 Tax=Methylacidiphilum caldifontis TaxID=2795386 RepID=A0A4Y8P6V5_9BACT|nr:DUF488 domain-containing protein [Methylacidiphilum caldifontis]QSR88837.1 DUF488 domain-containing protein [Methylacidiphilum caldifontis]TFE65906.1 hypothetical protein A7Q10_02800 [Methylacidiphilum caldifontis]